ncbi:uncharacterized protein LOC100844924 [Brachypodium distachyon]|uniref:DUF3615 domain-containing protein n=1 Tax=Brachypodium distachyon TaxID=15368 RepID=A0A0Q3EKY8_BRADI|nr:uncharacterized protein LOC100844924 [Brachypodium distachyon]KQJ88247.1 hypothetical protein BRADI_4g16590v3 [Brachypodium distachyon]|eukprot:XP_003577476.2 uncharacterized protein LOC100844924 [Brachypodium distachyon]
MAGAGDPHRPPPPRGTVGSSYLDMEEQTESHEEYISRLLGERPSQPQGDPSGEPSRELNLRYVEHRERCREERKERQARESPGSSKQGPEAESQGQEEAPPGSPRPAARAGTQSATGGSLRSPAPAGARVRQSVLYSDRPRRSRRPSQDKLPVEEHAGEVSSREFEALTLGQSIPTDSTHRVEEHAINKSSREFEAVTLDQSPPALDPTERSNECVYESTSSESESESGLEIEEEKPKVESDSDTEELQRKLDEHIQMLRSMSLEERHAKIFAAREASLAAWKKRSSAKVHMENLPGAVECARKQSLLDFSVEKLPHGVEWARKQALIYLKETQPRCEVSDEDIIQNAKKWMTEEAMVAFRNYAERCPNLKDLEYQFETLRHQCFNVECYYKIFHHYNFSVKVKDPSSVDWTVTMYFAEVKEIFGRKYYFCRPLESTENGHCYACLNQGVTDLRHPATGGFDTGFSDTVFPYM